MSFGSFGRFGNGNESAFNTHTAQLHTKLPLCAIANTANNAKTPKE
jgi:hypothetical protein